MKRLLYLLPILAVMAGCSGTNAGSGNGDRPIERTMACAAYYFQETDNGVHFTFYLTEDKENLVQIPDDPNGMKITRYVTIEFLSASSSPQGTYSLKGFLAHTFGKGEAILYDNCGSPSLGPVEEGTVVIGNNSVSVTGTTANGRSYKVTYSGTFQRTGYINTFVR